MPTACDYSPQITRRNNMVALIGLAAIAFIIWWFWLHPETKS
ncbi:hypothetical protein C942_02148 [Photobacterium marinum]|uniref:Uncharacterized protein n=1 Tax=Photobacterium marinum TaxID=1056511 RepID=L8JBI4_9GAMM|nr:hypothetical protein C942_02148 [Photobacterium marinum]